MPQIRLLLRFIKVQALITQSSLFQNFTSLKLKIMSLQSDAKSFPAPRGISCSFLRPCCEIEQNEAITVSKSKEDEEEFVERKELLVSSFEYPRNGRNPGLVLIFNQQSFEDDYYYKYRLGSKRDVNEIILSMSRLGFNINENHVFTDFKREEILKTIQEITNNPSLSDVNCLIVFFLSHGDSFDFLQAHDGSLTTNQLWRDFSECKYLKEKPKMFIVQACKGEEKATIASQHGDKQIELISSNTFTPDYIGPDMFVVYSTTEGNASFRNPNLGTWFIQELCKNFSTYGRRDDVISIVIRTTKCVCRNYYHLEYDKVKKQMPIFVSTLRKKFYLNRNKDRNIILKLITEQENMKNAIQVLEKKVDELVQEKEKKKFF